MAYYSSCNITGNKMFPSLGEAKEVIRKSKMPVYSDDGKRVKRRMGKRIEKRAYFCDHCKHWHLTSKEFYNGKGNKIN